jgi:hypothetical protein
VNTYFFPNFVLNSNLFFTGIFASVFPRLSFIGDAFILLLIAGLKCFGFFHEMLSHFFREYEK